jgi:hypothetical protein
MPSHRDFPKSLINAAYRLAISRLTCATAKPLNRLGSMPGAKSFLCAIADGFGPVGSAKIGGLDNR